MTKLLVLGLLDGGPMSGYDLQQKLGAVSYTHLTLPTILLV